MGKSTLVHNLAPLLEASELTEDFRQIKSLEEFYADHDAHAFRTEMEFTRYHFGLLMRRYDGGRVRPVVADFTLKRDLAFALVTLRHQPERLAYYKSYWQRLYNLSPKPSMVILLEAGVDSLLERIATRGREIEEGIRAGYLEDLSNQIRRQYEGTEAIIRIDTTDFEWLNSHLDEVAEDVRKLIGIPAPKSPD